MSIHLKPNSGRRSHDRRKEIRGGFGRDRALETRMLMTTSLLTAVYVLVVAAAVSGGAAAVTVLAVVAIVAGVQLLTSHRLALRAIGAREVSPAQEPKLHAVMERLCAQADIPKPRIAIVDAQMPNAFAIGRSRDTATVCVTTGLLSLLKPAELEAVLAHELTHVINRDMIVMTIASFLACVAGLSSRLVLRFGFRGHPLNQLVAALLTVLCSMVVYVVSVVLLQALSRCREFAADRGAAIITGRPSALSSALMRISRTITQTPDHDLRVAATMNAFFIVPARRGRLLTRLFASHPSLESRIAALSRLEAQLQRSK